MSTLEGIATGAGIAAGVVLAFAITFSVIIVRLYSERDISRKLPTTVAVLGLVLCFLTVSLVPIDIFLTNSFTNRDTGLRVDWANDATISILQNIVKFTYYVLYGLTALMTFFVIPFAYWYFEEIEDDRRLGQRLCGAFKYTIITVLFFVVILILGLVLQPSSYSVEQPLDFFKDVIWDNGGERAITFIVAVLVMLGMLTYLGYTAYGMSVLPYSFMQRVVPREEEDSDGPRQTRSVNGRRYHNVRQDNRENRRLLKDGPEGRERRSKKQCNGTFLETFAVLVRPFQIIFGIVLLLVSIFVIVSMTLSIIDKVVHSFCGIDCGYILDHPEIFNPMNTLFVEMSKFFPLDFVFLVLVILFFFFSTVAGIVSVGIRFLWIRLFDIRKHKTPPQGILLMTAFLMLSLLTLSYTVLTISPQYATFGNTHYCNNTVNETLPGDNSTTTSFAMLFADDNDTSPVVIRDCSSTPELIIPCEISAPKGVCFPSMISVIVTSITVSQPFFGVVFYYAQWVFVVFYLIGLMVASIKKKCGKAPREPEVHSSDSSDDD